MARNMVYPAAYSSSLSQKETQRAIKVIKDTFQVKLAEALNLDRVTAPVMVTKESGLNDDLNGVERKVHFTMKEINGTAEVVQSLAKWKRTALARYGYVPGEGIYTDMTAIRRDDDCDNLHSLYVDQWDWEKVITPGQRNVEYLKETVRSIVAAIADTQRTLRAIYPQLNTVPDLDEEVTFITTQELEDLYPDLTPKERENAFTREHHTTFLMQIGGALRSGKPHDGRAPDYDDWTLNGDLLVHNEVLGIAFELSSMGIRVDPAALDRQLTVAHCDHRRSYPFHRMLLAGELPLTIGGGIGQSRLCMFLMGCAHIGEVQSSSWDDATCEACEEAGIILL